MWRTFSRLVDQILKRSTFLTCLDQAASLAVPTGGIYDVIDFPQEDEKLKQMKHLTPRVSRKPKRGRRLRDSLTEDGQIETRRVRTKPRRKDYTNQIQHLKDCVQWKEDIITVGKYVEMPHYDPERRIGEDGNIDLECLPDKWEVYNPFTQQKYSFDFSMLPINQEDESREAKALRWTEENIPLRDEDLPIALRNPQIREKVLEQAFGPDSTPKDIWKIWSMKEPTAKDIDPWIVEEFNKLPIVDGKITKLFGLLTHPRTLRAAVEYLKIMKPSVVPKHVSNEFIQELSESLRSQKWRPNYEAPDPPNPYRMEDYEEINVKFPKSEDNNS
eukprot:g8509.t1